MKKRDGDGDHTGMYNGRDPVVYSLPTYRMCAGAGGPPPKRLETGDLTLAHFLVRVAGLTEVRVPLNQELLSIRRWKLVATDAKEAANFDPPRR